MHGMASAMKHVPREYCSEQEGQGIRKKVVKKPRFFQTVEDRVSNPFVLKNLVIIQIMSSTYLVQIDKPRQQSIP